MAKFWISQSKGCWVDLFDQPAFAGRRLRLIGPASFVNLFVAPEEWGDEIRSMVAGPAAYVQCFEELNFDNSIVWLAPNQQVMDVRDLPTREELDSICLFDRPPFTAEPGYDSYVWLHGGGNRPPGPRQESLNTPSDAAKKNRGGGRGGPPPREVIHRIGPAISRSASSRTCRGPPARPAG